MSFKLIDIAVAERHANPKIAGRVVGQVRAVLEEVQDGYSQQHPITVRVWIDAKPEMSDEDIDLALLLKASDIIAKVKARLDPGEPPLAAE